MFSIHVFMASALLFLLLWNNCSICDSATPECLLCYLSSHYVCSSAHRKGTQFLLSQISNSRCSFCFLHFALACLTELCSVRFWKISSFCTSKVSKLSMTVKIDYVTSDTRDVDPSWYGRFMCEWVKRLQGNKRIGVESRVTNLFIILFYYSVFC